MTVQEMNMQTMELCVISVKSFLIKQVEEMACLML